MSKGRQGFFLTLFVLPLLLWLPPVQRCLYPLAYEQELVRESRSNGLDPYLVAAIVYQESKFSPQAVSPVGAIGLMQLMPGTADEMARRHGLQGPLNLSTPALNLRLGTSYLKILLDRYDQDQVEALAAYNGGPSNVERWAGSDGQLAREEIGYPETREFVDAVLSHKEQYKKLYPSLAETQISRL